MEPNIWARIAIFLKESVTQRLKQSVSGFCLGIVGFHSLYFADVPATLVHDWLVVWLWLKTIVSAYIASVATSLGSYHVDLYKKKREKKSLDHFKKNKRTA